MLNLMYIWYKLQIKMHYGFLQIRILGFCQFDEPFLGSFLTLAGLLAARGTMWSLSVGHPRGGMVPANSDGPGCTAERCVSIQLWVGRSPWSVQKIKHHLYQSNTIITDNIGKCMLLPSHPPSSIPFQKKPNSTTMQCEQPTGMTALFPPIGL